MHKSRPNCTKLFGDVEHIHMDVCAKNLSYPTITYIIMSKLVVLILAPHPVYVLCSARKKKEKKRNDRNTFAFETTKNIQL